MRGWRPMELGRRTSRLTRLRMQQVRLEGNGGDGVRAEGIASSCLLKSCQLLGNSTTGASACSGSSVCLLGCSVRGNRECGLSASGRGATLLCSQVDIAESNIGVLCSAAKGEEEEEEERWGRELTVRAGGAGELEVREDPGEGLRADGGRRNLLASRRPTAGLDGAGGRSAACRKRGHVVAEGGKGEAGDQLVEDVAWILMARPTIEAEPPPLPPLLSLPLLTSRGESRRSSRSSQPAAARVSPLHGT
eukprot:746217-Hanusia_phi.AAC.2